MTFRLIALLCLGLLYTPLTPAFADPFRVAILVNSTPITDFEINARVALLKQLGDSGDDAALRQQAMDILIDEALQLELAEQQGVLPTRADAEASFATIADNNGQSVPDFEARLRDQGIDVGAFKSRLLPQLAWNAALGVVARNDIVVSDEDLDERWAEIQAQRGKTERRLIEVFIRGSKDQANDAAAKMREQGNFADFARARSASPLAAQGGDLGWVQAGSLSSAANAALVDLEPGAVSQPVAQHGGFYIYGVAGVRPVGALALTPIFDVRELFITLEAGGQTAKDIEKLQTLQNVFRRVDTCERFNQATQIYGEGDSGEKGFLAFSEMDPIVANVINATAVGTFSQLVPQPGGASIFANCGQDTREEPLTKDMVRNEMVSENVIRASADIMRQLRRQAYIEYR